LICLMGAGSGVGTPLRRRSVFLSGFFFFTGAVPLAELEFQDDTKQDPISAGPKFTQVRRAPGYLPVSPTSPCPGSGGSAADRSPGD
jgi:hypothetical protein